MAHRTAFRADDFLTCSECFNFRLIDGIPYCRDDRIRYNPCAHGCGDFGCGGMPSAPEGWTITAEQGEQILAMLRDRQAHPDGWKGIVIEHDGDTLEILRSPTIRTADPSHMTVIWTGREWDGKTGQVVFETTSIKHNQLANSFDFDGNTTFSLRLPESSRETTRTPSRTVQTTLEGYA